MAVATAKRVRIVVRAAATAAAATSVHALLPMRIVESLIALVPTTTVRIVAVQQQPLPFLKIHRASNL